MAGEKIGFIGIGVMGNPMSKNLLKAGFDVTVFDLVRSRAMEAVKAGAKIATSDAKVAENSDIVIVMVYDTDDARRAIFGRRGVWETVRPGTTIIFTCTIDPFFCKEVAAKGKQKGINVLDVAVSGAGQPVRDGTVTLLAGGDKAVLDRCMPVLTAMGKKVYHLGGIGSGEITKICNNYIISTTSAMISDCIKIASRAGLDLDKFHEALMNSSARSNTLEKNWGSLSRETNKSGEKVVKKAPRNLFKDLRLAAGLGTSYGIKVPLAALTSQLDLERYEPVSKKEPARGKR
ncbi:MAG: NAD(P)-dependent oxidoreductase [Dehalococcoidia bacterium]|nr:NAD(P)-dependent oxidoreductase [Dehalococcoidia bacterium]MDZ4246884.1 NAD(P)-dependent oxidoreductase [Dehalococcoidia bacterium]